MELMGDTDEFAAMRAYDALMQDKIEVEKERDALLSVARAAVEYIDAPHNSVGDHYLDARQRDRLAACLSALPDSIKAEIEKK